MQFLYSGSIIITIEKSRSRPSKEKSKLKTDRRDEIPLPRGSGSRAAGNSAHLAPGTDQPVKKVMQKIQA
jgi:hypothetical protein